MRKLFFALFVCSTANSFAQEIEFPKVNGDTLIFKPGLFFIKGEKIKMGPGAMPDGDFKYVRRSATSLFQYSSNNGY